jgi:hypothetical protein
VRAGSVQDQKQNDERGLKPVRVESEHSRIADYRSARAVTGRARFGTVQGRVLVPLVECAARHTISGMTSPTHTLVSYLGGPRNLLTNELETVPPVERIDDHRGAYVLDEDGRTYRWHVMPVEPAVTQLRPATPDELRPARAAGAQTRPRTRRKATDA